MAADRFTPAADDADLAREKARARALRQSAWWKRRVAAGVCHYCSVRWAPGPSPRITWSR